MAELGSFPSTYSLLSLNCPYAFLDDLYNWQARPFGQKQMRFQYSMVLAHCGSLCKLLIVILIVFYFLLYFIILNCIYSVFYWLLVTLGTLQEERWNTNKQGFKYCWRSLQLFISARKEIDCIIFLSLDPFPVLQQLQLLSQLRGQDSKVWLLSTFQYHLLFKGAKFYFKRSEVFSPLQHQPLR